MTDPAEKGQWRTGIAFRRFSKAVRRALLHVPFLRELLVRVIGERRLARIRRALLKGAMADSKIHDIQGQKMFLDPMDSLYLSVEGVHEPLLTRWVGERVKEGDVVVDCGAHIGYFTLLFSRRAGPHGKVYAFEPAPGNFSVLVKNVQMNDCGNVTLIPKAVLDHSGKTSFFQQPNILSGSACRDNFGGAERIEVEAVSLDEYFARDTGRIDLVKMDIEGAEYAALNGMAGILKKNPRLKLVVEFQPYSLACGGIQPSEFIQLIVDQGFSIWDMNESEKRIISVTPEELLWTYSASKHNWTNLLLERAAK